MDPLTAIPPIVKLLTNLPLLIAQALAERLLTVLLAIFLIGGVSAFIVSAFAWLWLKRAVADLHLLSRTAHN
jgi:hypothetical protein